MQSTRLVFADPVARSGNELFEHACSCDLEGIVAKHLDGPYCSGRDHSTWFKIRNPQYSQWEGRHQLFAPKDPFRTVRSL